MDTTTEQQQLNVSLNDVESPVEEVVTLVQSAKEVDKYAGQKWKGYLSYFIYTLFNACQYIVAKFLYISFPDLNPYQLVFIRSCFSIFYLMCMTNVHAKRIFYDEFDRKYLGPLIFRSFQSAVSGIINMVAVLHIDVVVVSLVNNTVPVFVCLLAMCFLGEKLKKAEVFFMTLSFGCVILIIMGQGTSSDSGGQSFSQAPWAYIALMVNPVLSAAGQIAQKKITKLDERVVTFWPQLTSALFSLCYIFVYSSSWDTLEDMAWWGWVLMALNGSFVIGLQITRFIALRYESASSLQKMAFLIAIYAFITDITIFGVSFSTLQLIGLGLSLLIYIIQLIYFVNQAKQVEKKDEKLSLEVVYQKDEQPTN